MNFQVSTKTLVSSLLIALVISIVACSYGQKAVGQTGQDQNPSARANLTAASFNALADNLRDARLGIMNNDSISAFNAINSAGADLFELVQSAAGGNETLFSQLNKELRPIHNSIVNTRNELRNETSTEALMQLNNADTRLLNATQGLPPGEAEE